MVTFWGVNSAKDSAVDVLTTARDRMAIKTLAVSKTAADGLTFDLARGGQKCRGNCSHGPHRRRIGTAVSV